MRTLIKTVALLVSITLVLNSGVLAQTAEEKQAAKVRGKLESIFKDGDRAKVDLKDGRKVQGYISELNADDFVLSNYGHTNTFRYADVKKVGRFGPSRSAKVWVPIAITGGLLALLIGIASQTR
ncbi:MAG TPA: hypothetical protein VD837_11305 [Terriglobales bacterium]|nr:hypothetical protein [Terriglobales bacterium]